MTVIGFTGHQNITPLTRGKVAASITMELAALGNDDLAGISSLAAGSDQVFAFCVLAVGGRLDLIMKARFRLTFS
jgi:hypothetical protein